MKKVIEEKQLTLLERIDKEIAEFRVTQKGVMDCSVLVFYSCVKMYNPTDLSAVGSVLGDLMQELHTLACEYLMEVKKLCAEKGNGDTIQAYITAYSSVLAHLKNVGEKQEIINYFMEKRVPTCFRENKEKTHLDK